MQVEEVLKIFEEKKRDYLRNIASEEQPMGILLGGQGAVGKGQLNHWAKHQRLTRRKRKDSEQFRGQQNKNANVRSI